MSNLAVLAIYLFLISGCSLIMCGIIKNRVKDYSEAPIIGIITQESETSHTTQELSGSYVNFIQAAGGRVVPIFIDKDDAYYKEMFNSINGLIFPGSWGDKLDIGSKYFPKSGYTKTGKKLFDMAVEANRNGDYFPILGSCNGFQLLVYLAAKETNLMTRCDAQDYATKLDFTNFRSLGKTRMFKDAPDDIKTALYKEPISYQYHNNCLTPKRFTDAKLESFFNIVATNEDRKGVKFITILEAINNPFYAIFIHPESLLDSFNNVENYCKNSPTSRAAIMAAEYFARFVVFEARKSKHRFQSREKEIEELIYNYQPIYTPHSVDCGPVKYSFPFNVANVK